VFTYKSGREEIPAVLAKANMLFIAVVAQQLEPAWGLEDPEF